MQIKIRYGTGTQKKVMREDQATKKDLGPENRQWLRAAKLELTYNHRPF